MTDIYDMFDKAAADWSAYAVLYDGKPIGRIVIRHGARTTCFAQVWGAPMVKGWANGGGYDKASAAVEAAVARLAPRAEHDDPNAAPHLEAWRNAMRGPNGESWQRRLEGAGYVVALVI